MKSSKSEKIVIGTIRVHPRGFGFVEPEDRSIEQIFIPPFLLGGAVEGDVVEILVSEKPNEKGPEGKVCHIIKRGRSHIAGTITHLIGKKKALAYTPLLGTRTPVTVNSTSSLKPGDRVVIHVTSWTSKGEGPKGKIMRVLGSISDPSVDLIACIEEYNLPDSFELQAIEEANALGISVSENECQNRKDLRNLVCMTIDPETAKDFDDALSITKDKTGIYHLGVHIADVSHYVKRDSFLDKEARERCNSIYFPGVCIPMLPEALSNELCSLKPKVDRLAVSVLMKLSSDGKILDYEIVRSVIHSRKRFSYEEAKLVLDRKKKSPYFKHLKLFVELCRLLKKERYQRGSIEFALPDVQILVDEKGKPEGLKLVEYDITHQLVEEFMLKTNEIVATHLSKMGKPLTYRIHDEPSVENLKEFAYLASLFGFKVSEIPTMEELQTLFDQARGSPHGQFLATSFIRSMKLASYSCENIGHYGLMLDHYTHFTSPIRRYIDLIVHRVLFNDNGHNLEEIAFKCSEQERLSAKAENSMIRLKKLRLLLKRQKETPRQPWKATVTTVKPMGFAFELDELLIEGFIHVSKIGRDFYTFNEKKKSLIGSHFHEVFTSGDSIIVTLKGVNLITGEAHFELAKCS
ncbi:MAG: VacB/RNase II family 3'-5' exoribonuclease [Chlamydiia bacterium]|nr:VacB/RNase II family 3'-5' exoribonuclease [Chlamydiia bacterium]